MSEKQAKGMDKAVQEIAEILRQESGVGKFPIEKADEIAGEHGVDGHTAARLAKQVIHSERRDPDVKSSETTEEQMRTHYFGNGMG